MEAERAAHLGRLMAEQGYAALLVRAPEHVLAFSGYLSLLGNVFCLVSLGRGDQPELRLIVPEDEAEWIPAGAAQETATYTQASLQFIGTVLEAVRAPLQRLLQAAGVYGGRIGYEGLPGPVVPAYTQVAVTNPATLDLLRDLLPEAQITDATSLIQAVLAVKTVAEIGHIRRAIAVAQEGMAAAREAVRVGAREADVAAAATAALLRTGYIREQARQVLAHVHVMAGARAAAAYKDVNLTSDALIEPGLPVSVQMEVGVDGYWAELTRPLYAGHAEPLWQRVHAACLEAQAVALRQIRAGVSGRAVDAAARRVMTDAGFGAAFKHGLGHGFGFQAINLNTEPVLHPQSHSVLRPNMLHNIEPAAYFPEQGGARLNDDVLVQEHGAELLSASVPRALDWLVVA